jgi:hypothetical protein
VALRWYFFTVFIFRTFLTLAGIACRLLFDLGLHQDCSDLVRTGHLSEVEVAIRFVNLSISTLYFVHMSPPNYVRDIIKRSPYPNLSIKAYNC